MKVLLCIAVLVAVAYATEDRRGPPPRPAPKYPPRPEPKYPPRPPPRRPEGKYPPRPPPKYPPPPPHKYKIPLRKCPVGYHSNFNNTSCYKVVQQAACWTTAWEYCRNDDAFLVSIETPYEQKHIVDFLESNDKFKQPDYPAVYYWGYWTSGNDIKKDGDFRWASNGLPFRKTFWNFAHGQPNNNYWGVAEMCVNLVQKWNWKWNDLACFDNFNYFICEKRFCCNEQFYYSGREGGYGL